jgi:hypothetical protein
MLLIPSSLYACCHFFSTEGTCMWLLWLISQMALQHHGAVDTSSSLVGAELSKLARVPTAPACKLLVVCSFICEGTGSSTVPCHLFSRVWQTTWLLALQLPPLGSAWGPHWLSCCLTEVAAVLCFSLLSHRQMPCEVPCEHGPLVVQERWWVTCSMLVANSCKGSPLSWVAIPYGQMLVPSLVLKVPWQSPHTSLL